MASDDPIRDFAALFPASANAYFRLAATQDSSSTGGIALLVAQLPLQPSIPANTRSESRLKRNVEHITAHPSAVNGPHANEPPADENDGHEPKTELSEDVQSIQDEPPNTHLHLMKFKSLDGLCVIPGCTKRVRSRGHCKSHGGGKRCDVDGCTRSSQRGGRCIRHGGGPRCEEDGCAKAAQLTGRCKAHGGGVRCQVNGCEKSSQGNGFCRQHGGGQRCGLQGCEKGAQRNGFCATHGGSVACRVEGCAKNDRGGGFCAKHGGGKRCTYADCSAPARYQGKCSQHANHSTIRVSHREDQDKEAHMNSKVVSLVIERNKSSLIIYETDHLSKMKPLRWTREEVVGWLPSASTFQSFCQWRRYSRFAAAGTGQEKREREMMPFHASVSNTQWLIRACFWLLVLLFVQPTLVVPVQDEAVLKDTPLTHPLWRFDGDARLLAKLLDTEQAAVKRQIELYTRKASIVRALLAQYEEDPDTVSRTTSNSSSTKQQETQAKRIAKQQEHQRSYQHQQQKTGGIQQFSDWFALHSSHSIALPSPPNATRTCRDTEIKGSKSCTANRVGSTRMVLLSFCPNASPTSKKNHASMQPGRVPKTRQAGSLGHSASSWPLLQFLLVFDMAHGHMDLLHPTTKELVWQHALFDHAPGASSRTRITDYFFASERMSYFATLSENSAINLYKLRVLYNKRLLSGGYRRQGRFDVAMCMLRSPYHHHHMRETNWMGVPLHLPWRTSAKVTTSPAANYLHVDFDLVFRMTGHDERSSNTAERERFHDGKIAVVSFYSHAYVIAATARGEFSFFHGENGTFIKTIDATSGCDQGVSTSSSIMQFKVLASGPDDCAWGRVRSLINGHDHEHRERPVAALDDLHGHEQWPRSSVSARALGPNAKKKKKRVSHRHRDRRGRKRTELRAGRPAAAQTADARIHQTALKAIPGYLIMATNTETVLYRTSHDDMGPAYIAEHTHMPLLSSNSAWFSPDNTTSDLPSKAEFVIGISVGKEPSVHPASLAVHYAVIETNANGSSRMPSSCRLDLYESLLPQPTSSLDLGWLRAPIMLLCAAGVMYLQQHTRTLSAQGLHGLPPGFDLARLSEMAKR
ncbi:hypothetical protein FI667_g2012, partial [Globisporangium splendens]